MPSGYTHAVATGEIATLEAFALRCARAMGACIMMRDDPADKPIPERFEPSPHYAEKVAETEAEIARVNALTDDECEAEARAAHVKALAHHAERASADAATRQRYEAMLAKVEAWDCRAEGIKTFMLEQLRASIRFDCRDDADPEPMCQTGPQWREAVLREAARSHDYYTQARDEEIVRTEGRNRWLADLRGSLPSRAEREVQP